jgi:DNA-binding MarR family transcriptional regulator
MIGVSTVEFDEPAKLAIAPELFASGLRAYQAAQDRFDEAIAEHLGINRTDLRCLDILERHGTLSAGQLAKEAGLTTGAMTFLLDRMERAALLRRRRDALDRRKVLVEVTPAARARAQRLHAPLVRDMRKALARFGEVELTTIVEFFTIARTLYEANVPPAPRRRRSASQRGRLERH